MRAASEVRWVLVRAAELPAGDSWLGAREQAVLAGLRGPRRESWRLGRWAAKRLLGPEVEVLAEAGGRPRAWRGDTPVPGWLSISHREGIAMCAAADAPVGCDVEKIEPRSAAFVGDYLTGAEQRWVAASEDVALAANLIWSAKESALKALGVGLTRDTREVEVVVEGESLQVRGVGRGWWRREGEMVVTVVRCIGDAFSGYPL